MFRLGRVERQPVRTCGRPRGRGRCSGPAAGTRRRVAVSSEAHASVGLALRVTGLQPLVVATEDHRLTGPALAGALAGDRGRKTSSLSSPRQARRTGGIVDDLAGVGRVRPRAWDLVPRRAYGGAALFADSARPLFAGVEHADSFVVDPHKWLFAPYDSAALLYRDPTLAEAVLTQHASVPGRDAHRAGGRLEPG